MSISVTQTVIVDNPSKIAAAPCRLARTDSPCPIARDTAESAPAPKPIFALLPASVNGNPNPIAANANTPKFGIFGADNRLK